MIQHDWKTDYSIPVMDWRGGIVTQRCQRCGATRTVQYDYDDKPVSHEGGEGPCALEDATKGANDAALRI